MKKAQPNDIDKLIKYMEKDIDNCIYMYIDIGVYGIKNPNMTVWYDEDENGINLVVMKYYESFQLFSDSDRWKTEEVIDLINEYKPHMISGKLEMIDKIYHCSEAMYDITSGYVYKINSYRKIDDKGLVELANENDAFEIAKLICMDEGIGGHYEIENLAEQLKDRMRTGMGRSFVIRQGGKIVAHNATYAEYKNIVVGSGLIVHPDYRQTMYSAIIDSYQINFLINENKTLYTFLINPMRIKLFKAMGNKECGRYGKLTFK